MAQRIEILRKELYEAVWEKPIRTLAKEWELSDVGLAKVCKKHEIPHPPLGYWAKVAAGYKVPIPPLKGNPDTLIHFSGGPSQKAPKLAGAIKEVVTAAIDAKANPANDTGTMPLARWTKKTEKALQRKPTPHGFISGRDETFRVSISESSRDRAVRLLNTLEIGLTAAGMAWAIDEKHHYVVGKMHGETIAFEMSERYARTEHVKKHPQYEWMNEKTYTYQFLDELVIRIEGWYEGRKSWSDGKTQRLEDKMTEVIAGFLAAAEAMRLKTIEREEQHRRWEEEARIRAERERIEREEREFLKFALEESAHWKNANRLRAYADHLRRTVGNGDRQLSEQGAAWIERLLSAADRLDPTALRTHRLTSE